MVTALQNLRYLYNLNKSTFQIKYHLAKSDSSVIQAMIMNSIDNKVSIKKIVFYDVSDGLQHVWSVLEDILEH